MKWIALILAGLWAGWWVSFEGGEAIGSGQYGQAALFLAVMGGTVVVASKWPLIGGALLVIEGLATVALFGSVWFRRFGAPEIAMLFLLMCAPPIVAGAILLFGGLRSGRAH